jgi:hypothetical protein
MPVTIMNLVTPKAGAKHELLINKLALPGPVVNITKLFTAVITPLAAYFSMIWTELRQ